jgi:hypothetical protein
MLASGTLPPPPAPGGKTVSADDWYRQTLNRQIPVPQQQVDRAVQMAADIRFATDHSGPQTTDGSDWIFEIEEAGRYQVVDFRNTPPKAARELGLFLVVELGGVTMEHSEVY